MWFKLYIYIHIHKYLSSAFTLSQTLRILKIPKYSYFLSHILSCVPKHINSHTNTHIILHSYLTRILSYIPNILSFTFSHLVMHTHLHTLTILSIIHIIPLTYSYSLRMEETWTQNFTMYKLLVFQAWSHWFLRSHPGKEAGKELLSLLDRLIKRYRSGPSSHSK